MPAPDYVFFVEGPTDRIFIENVIYPRLSLHVRGDVLIEYSGLKPEKRGSWVRSFMGMGREIIILTDRGNAPCFTACGQRVRREFDNVPLEQCVVVVESDIESWFLAGIVEEFTQTYRITVPYTTNSVTKEQFRKIMEPCDFSSELALLVEITRHYDISFACQRNRSFDYFCRRLGIS